MCACIGRLSGGKIVGENEFVAEIGLFGIGHLFSGHADTVVRRRFIVEFTVSTTVPSRTAILAVLASPRLPGHMLPFDSTVVAFPTRHGSSSIDVHRIKSKSDLFCVHLWPKKKSQISRPYTGYLRFAFRASRVFDLVRSRIHPHSFNEQFAAIVAVCVLELVPRHIA